MVKKKVKIFSTVTKSQTISLDITVKLFEKCPCLKDFLPGSNSQNKYPKPKLLHQLYIRLREERVVEEKNQSLKQNSTTMRYSKHETASSNFSFIKRRQRQALLSRKKTAETFAPRKFWANNSGGFNSPLPCF